MKKLPLLAVLVAACSSGAPPCVPAEPIETFYRQAARSIVESGACDEYETVSDCPQYAALELHYAAALEGTCQR
jgi:hypothetical protein